LKETPKLICQLAELLRFIEQMKELIPQIEFLFELLNNSFDYLIKKEFQIDDENIQLLHSLNVR
jgi:hypothetical protein